MHQEMTDMSPSLLMLPSKELQAHILMLAYLRYASSCTLSITGITLRCRGSDRFFSCDFVRHVKGSYFRGSTPASLRNVNCAEELKMFHRVILPQEIICQ
jgi:hypothetical protein